MRLMFVQKYLKKCMKSGTREFRVLGNMCAHGEFRRFGLGISHVSFERDLITLNGAA